MAGAPRRIDALYCKRETAGDSVRAILGEIETRCEAARGEVEAAIEERIAALKERQAELLVQIDRVAEQKSQALHRQLQTIEAGTCEPAVAEEDQEPDPNTFLLCADAAIDFKIGEDEDFLEKIPDLGSISEASTYGSRSFARGPALGVCKVGNHSVLWVYACDKDGSRRGRGGDSVTATFSEPDAFDTINVEDVKDGRYKVSFVPLQEGSYTLSVSIGPSAQVCEEVHDGPFAVTVRTATELSELGGDEEDPAAAAARPRIGAVTDPTGSFGTVLHPSGAHFDHAGRYLFVADQANHRVQIFDTANEHTPMHCYGKKGLGSVDFDTPCDIAIDNDNRVVVSDLLNHRIQVFEFLPRTVELRYVRTIERGFQFPKGLGVSDNDLLYIADSGNHKVQVFNLADECSFVREFGSFGEHEGQFNMPLSVAVNRAGEVLVSDSNDRISVFDSQGQFLRWFGTKGRKDGCFNYPVQMGISDEDKLFVCDQGNNRIQVLDATDGSFLHKWGGSKKKPGGEEEEEQPPPADEEDEDAEKPPAADEPGMARPSAVAVSPSGLVVVADYDRHVLWTF